MAALKSLLFSCVISLCGLPAVSAAAAGPSTLEEAIYGYAWDWTHYAPKNHPTERITFGRDGLIRQPNGTKHFTVTGPHTASISEGEFKVALTFDEDFSHVEGLHANGKYKYRGTRLEALKQEPPAPKVTALEALSQQAANADAWALSPLDVPVPADIRSNLTFLREDLLDEAKAAPKATPEAYQLGAQLCNLVIATLDERDRTLAQAGLRNTLASAQASVNALNRDSRPVNRLSWPEYSRERAQERDLKGKALSAADAAKEKPKLVWLERTVVLKQSFDAAYAKYRSALRTPAR